MDVSLGDYDNRTALHVAVSNGHLECAQFLVQMGADLNIKDRWGNSPLDEAIRENRTEIADFLRAEYLHKEINPHSN